MGGDGPVEHHGIACNFTKEILIMKKLLITVNGTKYEVDVEVVQDDEAIEQPAALRPAARKIDAPRPPTVPAPAASSRSAKSRGAKTDPRILTSPINGVVLEVPVKEGDRVRLNDVLFILEAMKMKTNISAPRDGTIGRIDVRAGDKIEAGQMLLTFD
jgi:biotin carboxyl carrier protein